MTKSYTCHSGTLNAYTWELFQVYEPEEEAKRMKIFMDNLKYIEDFNARKNRTMTLGLNAFSDLVSFGPKSKVG